MRALGGPATTDTGRYWCGVHRTRKGDLAGFITRNEDAVPPRSIETLCVPGIEEAKARVATLLKEMGVSSSGPRVRPGVLIALSDPEGVHFGAVINIRGEEADLVVLTSRPRWNPQARPATQGDLLAFNKMGTRTTFLAPVTRRLTNVYARGGELGTLRLEELRLEFDWSAAQGL